MSKPSLVTQLSPEIRAELDRRLIESGYTRFAEHSEWLKSKGCDISKSAIHRYTAGRWNQIVDFLQADTSTPIERAELRDLRLRALGVVTKDKIISREAFREADGIVAWLYGALPTVEMLEGGE